LAGVPMRRLAAVAVALVVAGFAHAQERGAVDWIFLLDTSASMKNIFPDVQESLKTFVREASDGDSVSLYSFDRDVGMKALVDLHGDRGDVYDSVSALKPQGNRTHLGAAIRQGLDRADALQQRSKDPTRVRAIVLFTDGKEDVKGIANPVPIPDSIQRALKSGASIFFVSMGEHEPQLDAFTNAHQIRATDAESIRQLAQRIRKQLPRRQAPLRIDVTPKQLTFGDIRRGKTTEARELTIDSSRPTTVDVVLEPAGGISMEPRRVTVPGTVKVQLVIDEEAAPGPRNVTIDVGKKAISGTLTIVKPLLWPYWAAAIAAALIAAIVFFRIRSNGNQLEGEIEIVAPRVPSDAAYVGLPNLKANEVALSAIIPIEALNGADARLFVRRSKGRKNVCIAASGGSLRVNDVETPLAELYDADTIRIGSAKLRFNRLGFERPQEDLA
ncbi:MAG TPA: vWA domain-containing protein, partial [Thermoanaerobaculia bacterium]|nr:vWA domain-containing protein [Thermoanaerobaculia bacterium]